MNQLHKTLLLAATAGTLWLSAATPARAAAPTTYDATGPVVDMTDTTLTIMYHGKEKWTFAKDATSKGSDAVKVGDKVTVHYTMTVGSVDVAKGPAAADTSKAKKGDKKAAATTDAQKPAAEASPSASPAAAH